MLCIFLNSDKLTRIVYLPVEGLEFGPQRIILSHSNDVRKDSPSCSTLTSQQFKLYLPDPVAPNVTAKLRTKDFKLGANLSDFRVN
jgi:hypothetical protein